MIWSLCVILKVLMMQADCNADINEKVLFITHVYTVIEQKKSKLKNYPKLCRAA